MSKVTSPPTFAFWAKQQGNIEIGRGKGKGFPQMQFSLEAAISTWRPAKREKPIEKTIFDSMDNLMKITKINRKYYNILIGSYP